MSKRLFLHIVEAVKQHHNYFTQRRIASGRKGLSILQKVTAAFWILAYGMPADATYEYIEIGESTAIECMKRFCRAIIEVFSERYNFEAVADYDLWIWHAYFGMPGCNNDINVLKSSNLFSKLAQGTAPPANNIIHGREYNMGYYLADGIYPKWSTIVEIVIPKVQRKNCLQQDKKHAEKMLNVHLEFYNLSLLS
ncbi:uncharacterized protein LOC103849789 [Brassica rapa]|uniref:uncharacterized protein LOC103849789 n=1 Tax=Brassica campestris TaxID=3711 RepID=UPI0004F15CFC|nr:uncharacterized protein LOC103849789 [Brassica rapa]